jgi:hypothetical protein
MSGDALPVAGSSWDGVELSSASNRDTTLDAESVSWAGADRRQEASDVLEENPTGRKLTQDPVDFPEQAASCAVIQACTTTGHGEILARESCCDDGSLWNSSNVSKSLTGHLSNIFEDGHAGESVFKNRSRVRIDLT